MSKFEKPLKALAGKLEPAFDWSEETLRQIDRDLQENSLTNAEAISNRNRQLARLREFLEKEMGVAP
jgi:hypothetical protein